MLSFARQVPHRIVVPKLGLIGKYARFMSQPPKSFKKVMSCNRGEISIRFSRAGYELGLETVSVFSKEDSQSLHRYKADQAFMIGQDKSPVGAYLDIDDIIRVAKENKVDAIHPGYGLLSENENFAKACEVAGIEFIGPPSNVLGLFGDKTSARALAIEQNVPVIPGTDGPCNSLEDAREFIEGVNGIGYPVMVKATQGGGGRGMRVVRTSEELEENYNSASREALTAFGDGSMFIERLVERPRHVEVQIIADGKGGVVHLFERDCSVQRRHQKMVEIAPALGIPQETREALWSDAIRLCKVCGYKNAGTVEFLVDEQGRHYFIEVNPRIQVEHTVTEEVTGIDIVQTQIKIAEGNSLEQLGLVQDEIQCHGFAIQARVTTEDPANGFAPDYGRIDTFRAGEGMGIRLDVANGFTGSVITPHYDSLLMKVTASALTYELACKKLSRSLHEFRVRGLTTNIPFIRNVLKHPVFLNQNAKTDFIETYPELYIFPPKRDRANKTLKFLAEMLVNGHPMPGCDVNKIDRAAASVKPVIPSHLLEGDKPLKGYKQLIDEKGPEEFAKTVLAHPRTLFSDTTWRDAHQSLYATRFRTIDMLNIAPATASALNNAYAIEMWGGATFDVALRFLREDPWHRLEKLREVVPNVPFQMLLRGANAVGYTSYPDNVVHEFVREARLRGVDVFRVFDSVNYADNLLLGCDAVHKANGVVQGEVCFTGDLTGKYDLDYYLETADMLVNKGHAHVLGVKDMAGLMTPAIAAKLTTALKQEFPNTPLHIHTHDTGGVGVASMISAATAGADVVHGAIDCMSGSTSQPSLGALVKSLGELEAEKGYGEPDIKIDDLSGLNDYWSIIKKHYSPFEQIVSGSSDVFKHQMPGGQYTNLMFQSQSMGLSHQWNKVKDSYHDANLVLGDIVKVTPSSKVVGDLAQFMVTNDLSHQDVIDQAHSLSLPSSVVEFLQGQLGQPKGGFPEPLRSQVLAKAGLEPINNRPGQELPSLDFNELKKQLIENYGDMSKDGFELQLETDVLSKALYPQVFKEYAEFCTEYGDVSNIPTNVFLTPMIPGQQITIDIEKGKSLYIKYLSKSAELDEKGRRTVVFELNGVTREVRVLDRNEINKSGSNSGIVRTIRADKSNPGHVGAPMPGTIISLHYKEGDVVKKGSKVAVLSAMKMETVVSATKDGIVKEVYPIEGDLLSAGDLILAIE
mmetsp:Transcript_33331/g.39165  ORF Transcript_33331/g.39165 Transcript_33331/m.39165 type:complete len:1200 (+) Transcript_33331:86-3685(+)